MDEPEGSDGINIVSDSEPEEDVPGNVLQEDEDSGEDVLGRRPVHGVDRRDSDQSSGSDQVVVVIDQDDDNHFDRTMATLGLQRIQLPNALNDADLSYDSELEDEDTDEDIDEDTDEDTDEDSSVGVITESVSAASIPSTSSLPVNHVAFGQPASSRTFLVDARMPPSADGQTNPAADNTLPAEQAISAMESDAASVDASAVISPILAADSFRPAVLWPSTFAAAATGSDESILEFRSPKRMRLNSPKRVKPQSSTSQKSECHDKEEEEGNHCSICFEPWDNSGRHRLASLKCGHLFGLGCIEKWLKGANAKCPSCNEKAKLKDIRVIYAKAIKTMDTTERDRALQDLEREKEQRRKAEIEAAQARLRCQVFFEENRRLREEIDRLREELFFYKSQKGGSGVPTHSGSSQNPAAVHLQGSFKHEKTIKIWENGSCRVLAHCSSVAALVISQPSANLLFPGFGIKKISCMDFKTSSYTTLHQKAIRGICFHQNIDDGILLSCSMDRTVKLTSVITNSTVQTYTCTMPLWSCEWNADNQTYFYVGQQNGQVLEFDTRTTTTHVRQVSSDVDGNKSPVVALQYLPRNVNAAFRPGGLIVGQLDRVSFYESKGDNENRLHMLPLEGSLTCLDADHRTRHLLASFRPAGRHPSVRHQLCELTSCNSLDAATVSCNVVHTFHGGRSQMVLGKTMLMTHPADDSRLLVVAGDEQSESTHLWDTGTSQLVQRLPCQGAPVDFSTFSHNGNTYLAVLTDKMLKLHRWS